MPQNEVVYLCPGEHHSIVCSTNQTHLLWMIRYPLYTVYYRHIILISSSMGYDSFFRYMGDTTINITKNSEPGALPLTSTLQINSINTSSNGTMITCSEYNIGYGIKDISITSMVVINGKVLMHAYSTENTS